MIVAMFAEGSVAALVPDGDAFAGDNFADAAQFKPGESMLPGIEQFHGITAGNREKQFKIFAVGERMLKRFIWSGGCLSRRTADWNIGFE